MSTTKPYTAEQAEDFIRSAVAAADKRHERWRLLQALYRTGSIYQAEQAATGKIADFMPNLNDSVLNLVLPHMNIILASVTARDPKPLATPYGGGEIAEKNREVAEGVMQYWWHRLRATKELRDATQDAVHLGAGFLKTGWRRVEAEVEREEWQEREEALDLIEADRRMQILSGVDEPELLDPEDALGMASHTENALLENGPYVEYVSPFDFFVPQECRRIEDARWVAHRVSVPADEVLANEVFNVTEDTLILDGTSNTYDRYQAEWKRQSADELPWDGNPHAIETATLWEFYDMRSRRLTVMQLGAQKPIFEGDFYWDHAYSPFVHVRNYRYHGNDFWGFGDLESAATAQGIYNDLLSEAIDNARHAGQKYLSRRGSLDEKARSLLQSPNSDVVAEVDVPNGEPLDQVIVPVARAALSGDVYRVKDEMEIGIQKLLGINDFQAGGVGADRMSATAAAVVDGVATLRAQDKIHSVEDAASDVCARILFLCQEFLDEPTAVRIAGVEGATWEKISRDDLYGEFIVRVESGSTRAVNPATREQQGMRTLVEVMPLIAEMGYDPTPALRSGLRDLGYDPDIILAEKMQQPGAEGGLGGLPGGVPVEEAPLSSGEEMVAAGGPPQPAMAQEGGGVFL